MIVLEMPRYNIPSQHVALKNGISYERDFVDNKGRLMRLYTTQRA